MTGTENNTESNWEDEEETKRYWKTMLEEREIKITREEQERERRIKKAEKLERSWLLLKLCREVMSKEGENWRISKERKEEERRKEIDKHERLETASRKKEAVRTKQKCKELQTRITDELNKMPKRS